MKHDLNCFDPNSIELCIFCGLYFDFVLSPVFQYKNLYLSTLPRPGFPGSHRVKKNITDLFCFKCVHYKVLFVLFFLEEFHQASEVNIYLNVLKT